MNFEVEFRNHTFSHSSRINKVDHKFSVGELAFIKMKDELCLVFIHYLSQKLVFCACSLDEMKVIPIGLSDYECESIYHDYRYHRLYYNKELNIGLNNIHIYYIPMYFISFPGYRRKCSKFFRFWVKECDLIPYNSVKSRLIDKPIYKLEEIGEALKKSIMDSDVDNIEGYVYYNGHRNIDISRQLFNGIDSMNSLPWLISDSLKRFMNDEFNRITNIDWGMDLFCNFISQSENLDEYDRVMSQIKLVKRYTNVPFYRKYNAKSIANEFKFYILLLGKILLKSDKNQVKIWNKEIKISYQCFVSFYVNQLYWIDLMLDWFDLNFIDTCCFCKEERIFLLDLLSKYKQVELPKSDGDFMSSLLETSIISNSDEWSIKPSDILGVTHLARLLCYPIYYNNYINKLSVDGIRIEGLCLPIYQLFINFITYCIKDYTQLQDYTLE